MSTIPQQELRCNSAEILRRVEAGESFVITADGRAVARLVPSAASPLDVLRESGRVTGTQKVDAADLPAAQGLSSRGVLDDLRSER
jgi:prevent-host-death family protein